MRNFNKLLTLILIILSLGGCAVTPVSNYDPASFANIRDIDQITQGRHVKIAVLPFTSSVHRSELVCRPGYPIKLTPGQHFSHYLRQTLISDLKAAHIYSANAKRQLVGHLDKVTYVADVFGNAVWTIQMTFRGTTLSGKKIAPFTITSHYQFFASTQEKAFCRFIAEAFPDAAQVFLDKLFTSVSFKKLLR